MSGKALREALWGYKPGYTLTIEEQMALEYGWNAAMNFMASPRIPAPAVPKPLPITEHSLHAPPKVSVPVAFGLLDWAESILCNAKPMDHCSQEEWDGIIRSWRDQKHGIEQPPKPALHPTDPHQRQYYVPPLAIKWSEEEKEILRRAAEAGSPPLVIEYPHLVGSMDPAGPQFFEDAEHPGMMRKGFNPHGLVAFYTDAPVKPWGHKEGHVDHPKGCACGLCEPEESPDV